MKTDIFIPVIKVWSELQTTIRQFRENKERKIKVASNTTAGYVIGDSVVFRLRTNVSDFCGFFLALYSSVQKGQNA